MRGEPDIDLELFFYNLVIFRLLIRKGEHYLLHWPSLA